MGQATIHLIGLSADHVSTAWVFNRALTGRRRTRLGISGKVGVRAARHITLRVINPEA